MLDDAQLNQRTWELMSQAGEEFFSSMVEHLAIILGVRIAFIVESMDLKGGCAAPLATWGVHGFRGEQAYHTRGTPCERLASGASDIYLDNLPEEFPDDVWLQQSGMQSYVAVPLLNEHAHVLGHMGVLDDRVMENPGEIIDLLEAFVPRAREEILRNRLDTGLQRILGGSNWLLYRATAPRFSPRLQTSDGAGFLGYTRDELALYEDLHSRQLFEEDRPRVLQTFTRALEKGQDFVIEYRLWDRQRERLHRYRDHGQVERDGAGKPLAIVGALVDITAQLRREDDLRKDEVDVLNRLGDLPGLTYRADRGFVIQFAGSGARTLTGYSSQALKQAREIDFNQLIHPRDRTRVQDERERATVGQPGFNIEYRITDADNHVRRVLETGSALFDEEERISGFEGFLLDQTKHYRTLQELHVSEQQFRVLFDNITCGMLFVDPETGRFHGCNRSICEMLGYSKEELEKLSVRDIYPEEDLPRVMEEFRRLVKRKKRQNLDIPMKRKDGSLFHTNISIFWIKHQGKEFLVGGIRDVTGNRKTEQALRLEKEKLAGYLDNAPVMTLVLDASGTVLLINRAGCEVLGRPLEDIIGRDWFEQFLPARLSDEVRRVHDRMIADDVEPIGFYENLIIDAQGEERMIAWHNTALRSKQGNIIATLSSGEDITDERNAERALESARKRLRFVVRNAPAIIFVCEAHEPYAISYLTDNAMEQLGYNSEQLVGESGFWSELAHPDDLEDVVSTITSLFHQGRIQTELRIRLNSGGYRWYQNNMKLVRDSEERPVEIIGYLVDIHRTKEAELALQDRRARLSHAQKLTHMGSWERDLVSADERWSSEIYRIFGYAPQAFIPSESRMLEFVHPDDRERFQSSMHEGLDSREQFDFEFRVRRDNAEVRFVRALNEVVRDRKGKAVSLLGTLQDVTEQRHTEAQLRRSHEELRRLADHLQSAREDERISIAREIHDEMAQSLTAQKIDMVRLKSKLPLDATFLTELSGEILDSINQTINSVQRILTELRPALLDDLGLVAAIEWQVNEFRHRAEIECHLALPDEEPDLTQEERTALFRILQESLSNVLRHANATEVRVELILNDSWLLINIADNGKGISDLEVLGSRSFGLMGMRERAHIFGGTVTIQGEEGKGATVSARIPLNGRRRGKGTSE